jgi:NADH-quinone oxidoreductase subunit C
MRRDYVEPDDFEYEPTAHDQVLARALAHQAASRTAQEAAAPALGAGQEGTGASQ